MNKLYSVHDHWTDINKKNDVDIESIDGVITGIKVNGEDYGGGGESDFSTAQVTIICNIEDGTTFEGAIIRNNRTDISQYIHNGSNTITCILYKGENYCGTYDINMSTAVITGNARYSTEDDCYIITGDCTITIS